MAATSVFYSWQSDTPSKGNRSFIEKALGEAIKRLKSDAAVEPAVRAVEIKLDKDTQGVPGSPPIAETILRKVELCTAFVADLTLVGESLSTLTEVGRTKKRFFPNPNVLIEYGYALHCHGHDCLIAVLNTAFGESHTENLPFDLRHLRWPIKYHLPTEANSGQREAAFEALVSNLTEALKLILKARNAPITSSPIADFEPRSPAKEDVAVFFEQSKELIPGALSPQTVHEVDVPKQGRAYLRLYPFKGVPPFQTALDARTLASRGGLLPMGIELSGWSWDRNVFGAIAYDPIVGGCLNHLTQLFLTRELWGIDAYAINADRCKPYAPSTPGFIASKYVERMFTVTLTNYLTFTRDFLKLPIPLQLEAGLSGVKDYPIAVQHGMPGRILTDQVRWTGTIPSYEICPTEILRPFFEYMWAECGVVRPESYQVELEERYSWTLK